MNLIDVDRSFDPALLHRLHHQLAGHPLLSTEALSALALRIAPEFVRFHDGERRISTDMAAMLATDPTRERLKQTLERLDRAKAFVQLINVRSDPAYRALIDAFLDEVVRVLPPSQAQLLNRDAAVFLSSPRSVTPFHLDHEQNFLCHVRGRKRLKVWEPDDRSLVSARALEIFFREGSLREVVYRPEFALKAHTFDLGPGDAVFMPMGAPHAVTTGEEVTVTFSVLMNTRASLDEADAHRANYRLRQLGFEPTPVGRSRVRDALVRGNAAGAAPGARPCPAPGQGAPALAVVLIALAGLQTADPVI